MIPCRLVDVLASLLPLRIIRDSVRLRHEEKCPKCQEKLLSKWEARPWIFEARDMEDDPNFWPAVKSRIQRLAAAKSLRPLLLLPGVQKWAAIAGLALLMAAGFLIVRTSGPRTMSPDAGGPTRFRLDYLKSDGAPVEPVIIQPRDTDLVIIWVDGVRQTPTNLPKGG
jgi:hypothetical protein